MRWLRSWWRRVEAWVLRRPPPLRTIQVEELPDELRSDSVYVVGESSHAWSVAMLCPCGCGATLEMSLMEGRPRWCAEVHDDGTMSLSPSVWRRVGCRSHFFVRRGQVAWC